MLVNNGPKFTESVGLQPTCRYCGRMFKSAQGLSTHIYMHERAGDHLLHGSEQVPVRVVQQPAAALVPVIEPSGSASNVDEEQKSKGMIENHGISAVPARPFRMTRRFTITEKLKIIEKYKENDCNVSVTCRWVQSEFKRQTFDRKSLRTMVSREHIFRQATGTKRARKTVRERTGYFHRMDRELAK